MVHLVANLYGKLVWVSEPFPGSTDDANAIEATGLLDHAQAPVIGDRADIGKGMITPVRKPAGGQLDDQDRAYNEGYSGVFKRIIISAPH